MLVAHLNNQFVVEIKHHVKKNKTDNKQYDLYLQFTITQNGFTLGTTEFSVNKTLSEKLWGSPKTLIKGTTAYAKSTNTTLNGYENKAKIHLEKNTDWKTWEEIKAEIQSTVRTEITGKAARGQKWAMKEKLMERTVSNLITQIKTTLRRGEKPLSMSRKRLYDSVYGVLRDFFRSEIPMINSITKKQMLDFKNWYYRTYNHKPETRTTYLGVIAAIFRFAVDDIEWLSHSPIPKGFTPIVKNRDQKERYILEEAHIRKLYTLKDEDLTDQEFLAKTVMTLQICTGMAYCDIITLRHENVKHNNVTGEWRIRKQRAKSGEVFTVTLSQRAKFAHDTLLKLAAGTNKLFNLPPLRVINKQYTRLSVRAEIHPFTSYNLRHSFAVHFMDHGGRIEDLAEILGHQKLETTRRYGKISESRRSQTMNYVAQSLIHQL